MFEPLFAEAGLSLDRLRSLVEVDEANGITGAAPGDPVRQSQISRNLSQLETFFGVELKRRRGKGIELTPEGKRLATLARESLLSLEGFLGDAKGKPQPIRIGASHSTLEWVVLPMLVPRPLHCGDSATPELILQNMRSHEVVAALNDFSIDFGVVRRNAITTKRILTRTLATTRYVLISRRTGSLSSQDDALALMRKTPLALSMGGEYRRHFEDYCREIDLVPQVAYSCSSFRLVLELLKQEPVLAGLLPEAAVQELDPDQFVTWPLPGFEAGGRELVLAWHDRLEDLRPGVMRWWAAAMSESESRDFDSPFRRSRH